MSLSGEMDWLLRPWSEGLCPYASLKDGTLDLVDIALMNDALDVKAENIFRANEKMRANK